MERRELLLHGLAAMLLVALILAWGALLSPPFRPLREALGIPSYPGERFNGFAADIIAPDPGAAAEYLARLAHYYHSLFAALLYGTLAVLLAAFPHRWPRPVLLLGLAGASFTAFGGILYAYGGSEPWMHGLFIAGLAILFASGVLAALGYRGGGWLARSALTAGVLLLVGGAIGGYLGASFMNDASLDAFREAVIASRFDPDLAEENWLWRAWTAHQHAMIALALVLAFAPAARLAGYREEGRLRRLIAAVLAPSAAVMALASYSVWLVGGGAHLIITPAALTLVTATLAVSALTPKPRRLEPRATLAWALLIGNIGIWLFVNLPGAIIAMSLRKPLILDPPVRSPERDWMELAFNIGHWHFLLAAWGVALAAAGAVLAAELGGRARLLAAASLAAVLGLQLAGLGYTLYSLLAPPGEYSPNPYDNVYLKLVLEPGLALVGAGVAAVGVAALHAALLPRGAGSTSQGRP